MSFFIIKIILKNKRKEIDNELINSMCQPYVRLIITLLSKLMY